jgi:GTPase SAR1 family protein
MAKAVQKIVILGNAAVGKTCLMERYISGKCVDVRHRAGTSESHLLRS